MANVKVNRMASIKGDFTKKLKRIHNTAALGVMNTIEKQIENYLGATFRRNSSPAVYPDGSSKSNPGFGNAEIKFRSKVKPAPGGKGFTVYIKAQVIDKGGRLHPSWHIMTAGRKAIIPIRAQALRWFERSPQNVSNPGSLLVEDFGEYGEIVFRPYAKAVKGRKWYQAAAERVEKENIKQYRAIGWVINIKAVDKK